MICQCVSQWIILWLSNLTTNGVIPSRLLFVNVGLFTSRTMLVLLSSYESLTCRRGLAEYKLVAPRVRYAGCIPADEPLVLIRRTFGLFRGTPQRYPSSCICIQGPKACSARWASIIMTDTLPLFPAPQVPNTSQRIKSHRCDHFLRSFNYCFN